MSIFKIVISGLIIVSSSTGSFTPDRGIFRPPAYLAPYIVYFNSYYRGTCVGTLVSPTRVLTAAVCVRTRSEPWPATKPITVVLGSHYRHKMRGVRVPVSKVYMDAIPAEIVNRTFILEHSIAILQLAYATPEHQGDFFPRPLQVDFTSEPEFKEECLTMGWNFYTGYRITDGKFRLQKNLHMQFLTVEHEDACKENSNRFDFVMDSMGFDGLAHANRHFICMVDTENKGLPCHGMFGAPLVCRGRVMGVMTAPDASLHNCSGSSVMFHSLAASAMRSFMECIDDMFRPSPIDFSELYEDPQAKQNALDMKAYYDYTGERPGSSVEEDT